MGNTLFSKISTCRIVFVIIPDLYSDNKILWKFSIIYESGILGIKVLLSQDYGYWSQTRYYKYTHHKYMWVSGHLGIWTSRYWTYATSRYSVLDISVLGIGHLGTRFWKVRYWIIKIIWLNLKTLKNKFLHPNLRFKLQNERVSVYRLWQQCPSRTGGFTMWPVFTVATQIMQHW